MSEVTRFAPSPTGRLHLGHAYSALFAFDAARAGNGQFLLRIEDIDAARCRPEFDAGIIEDLAWLGLRWPEPVRRQSEYFDDYGIALDRLSGDNLLYPCFCTRAEIKAEIARAAEAPHGPDGPLYPGTCRALTEDERRRRIDAGDPFALRLDVATAIAQAGPLSWFDQGRGLVPAQPEIFGDVVLARKDIPASYHLAVTLDDHIQGVTLVTRGEDLFPATHIHRLLQALLGLDTPTYHHHHLVRDTAGQRLAKRAGAPTLDSLRAHGMSPEDVRRLAREGAAP